MDQAWAAMQKLTTWRRANDHWQTRRAEQARHWFAEEVRQGLLSQLTREPARGLMDRLSEEVAQGRRPEEAAAALLAALRGG